MRPPKRPEDSVTYTKPRGLVSEPEGHLSPKPYTKLEKPAHKQPFGKHQGFRDLEMTKTKTKQTDKQTKKSTVFLSASMNGFCRRKWLLGVGEGLRLIASPLHKAKSSLGLGCCEPLLRRGSRPEPREPGSLRNAVISSWENLPSLAAGPGKRGEVALAFLPPRPLLSSSSCRSRKRPHRKQMCTRAEETSTGPARSSPASIHKNKTEGQSQAEEHAKLIVAARSKRKGWPRRKQTIIKHPI